MDTAIDILSDLAKFKREIPDDLEYFTAAAQHIINSIACDKTLKRTVIPFLNDAIEEDKGIITAIITQIADLSPDAIKNFPEMHAVLEESLSTHPQVKLDPTLIMDLFGHSDYRVRILGLSLLSREIMISVRKVNNTSDDTEIKIHESRMIKEWTQIISDYFYDENSYVRARALQEIAKLAKERCTPTSVFLILISRIQSRVLDTTSTVRSKALEAATELLINNSLSTNLNSEYLQNQLAEFEGKDEEIQKYTLIQSTIESANNFRQIVQNIASIITIAKESEFTNIYSYLVAASIFKLDGLIDVLQQLICHLASNLKPSLRKLVLETLTSVIFGKSDLTEQTNSYLNFVAQLPFHYDKVFLDYLKEATIPKSKEICLKLLTDLNNGNTSILRPLSLIYQSTDLQSQSITAVLIKHIYLNTRANDELIIPEKPMFLLELLTTLSSTVSSITDPGPVVSTIQPLLAYRLHPQLWVSIATEIFCVLESLLSLDEVGIVGKQLIAAHSDWEYSVHVHLFVVTRYANLLFKTTSMMIAEKEKRLKVLQATQEFTEENVERIALESGLANAAQYQNNMVSPYLDIMRTVGMAAIDCLEENLEDQFITILSLQCATAVALCDKKLHSALLPYLSQIISEDPSQHLRMVAIACFGDLMMANVDISWNSMYRNSIYIGCRDDNVEVARTALAVISKLLMQAVIKPDHGLGHILALTVSTDAKSRALALHLCHQLASQTPSPLYNFFGDIIGEIRLERSITNEDFRTVMKLILSQIRTAKENEGLLMKLFERIENSDSLEDARCYSECLSYLKLQPTYIQKLPHLIKETISRKWLSDSVIVNNIIDVVNHHHDNEALKEIQRIVQEMTAMTIIT